MEIEYLLRDGGDEAACSKGVASVSSSKTVFVFSAEGLHQLHVGRELFQHNSVFLRSMLRLDSLAQMLDARLDL